MTLRPLSPADRDALIEAASTDGLWDLSYASVSQMKDPEAFLARAFRERDAGRAMPFAVLDRADIVCGTTRFLRMNAQHRRVEIGGTFYATRVQRTGVNTEAKLLLLTHAFKALGCQCVQIRTDALNLRSQTAIERLGAKRDGVLRGHQVMPDGRVRDSMVYSILDREWPAVRQNLQFLLARHGDPA
ncbi:GNAT family N-acetyltransferase [uncultured Sphingomonas sp.]|uniref:GNAT family N-acetyltransferase n=1 Tax=uncultured Sphingomonas sp. TaxID=158754 RepID=UPI0035C972EC